MASPAQTVAGHPIAMKVGGRRLSVSKSPSANKSYPNASKDKDGSLAQAAPGSGASHGQPCQPVHHSVSTDNKEAASATTDGAPQSGANKPATSPTADQYPRPTADHPSHDEQGKKEEQKKEEGNKDAKKVPVFDKNPKHAKDNFNKHPPSANSFPIKQPAGKV